MKIQRTYQTEVNELPSLTDPSQNIELRTIVDRFVKGLPIPAVGHVLTPDDFDAVDNDHCPPSALDISEVKDIVDRAADILDALPPSSLNSGNPPIEDTGGAKTESSGAVPPDGGTQ